MQKKKNYNHKTWQAKSVRRRKKIKSQKLKRNCGMQLHPKTLSGSAFEHDILYQTIDN